MTQTIYLSRHGQTLANVINISTDDPIAHLKAGLNRADYYSNEELKIIADHYGFDVSEMIKLSDGLHNLSGDHVIDLTESNQFWIKRLTHRGRNQARVLGEFLQGIENVAYITSGLERTMETANIAAGITGKDVFYSSAELDEVVPLEFSIEVCGRDLPTEMKDELNGLSIEELKQFVQQNPSGVRQRIKQYPVLKDLFESKENLRSTLAEHGKRLVKGLAESCERYADKNIVAVLHGNVNWVLLNELGIINERCDKHFFSNCGLIVLERDGYDFNLVGGYRSNKEMK